MSSFELNKSHGDKYLPELESKETRLVTVHPNGIDNPLYANGHNGISSNHTGEGEGLPSDKPVTKKEKKKKEKKPAVVPVGPLEIFRYSDCLDRFLMFIGIIAASAQGIAFPAMILIFGDMIDLFNDQNFFAGLLDDFLRKNNDTAMLSYNTTVKYGYIKTKYNPPDTDFVPKGMLKEKMGRFSLIYVGIGCGVLVASYFQVTSFLIAAERQMFRIRNLCFRSIMHQEIGWFDLQKSGELTNQLTDDILKIHEGIGDKFGQGFQWLSACISGIVIGFVKGWLLTLIILSLSPLLIGGGYVFTRLTASFTQTELKSYAKAGAVAEEVLGAIRTVYAFGGEKKESERYSKNLDASCRAGLKKGLIVGVSFGFIWFVIFCAYALAFWRGAALIREDPIKYSSGMVMIVFFCVLIAAMALGQAAPSFEVFNVGRGAARSIFDLIERKSAIDSSSSQGRTLENLIGDIELRDVQFEYPSRKDVTVMRNFSIRIPAGKTVALVGASGCGKSTTVQLVQRFYDPLQGQVFLDNVDIRELNVLWLRSQIGIVSQEPVLFACSIAENIRYGREGVTMEEIERACEMANAKTFIEQLPNKYDTQVGDRGTQLSGGQKQRIAIARALVKNPKILLLDEATSALDLESEAVVQEALDKARHGRTTIVVAHRLSTIRTADIIAGIANGEVKEMGTHEELMIQQGIYATLVQNQTIAVNKVQEESSDTEEELDTALTKLTAEDAPTEEILERINSGKIRSVSTNDSHGALSPEHHPSSPGSGRFRRSLRRSSVREEHEIAAAAEVHDDSSKKDKKKKKGKKEKDEDISDAGFFRLMRLNASEWYWIVLGCVAAIINGGVQPAFAVVFSEVIKDLANTDLVEQERRCNMFALIFFCIGIASFIAMFVQMFAFSKSGEILTKRCRRLMFDAMMKQDMSYFDNPKNNLGALTTRLSTDATHVKGGTGSRLGTAFQAVASLGTGVVIAFASQWKLAFVILGFVPFIMVGGLLEMMVMQGYATRDKAALEGAGKIAVEGIENIRTVVSLTREATFVAHYRECLTKPHKTQMMKVHLQGIGLGITQGVIFFCYAASFYFGAYLIENDEASMTVIFRVFGALVFGAMAVGQASAFAPDAGKAKSAAGRMFFLLDRKPLISENPEGHAFVPGQLKGETELHKVRFRYPTRLTVPVLRGLDLRALEGKRVALVGTSGCGKSTVIQLLERFYDPLEGEVTLDSVNLREARLSSLRASISLVSQEPILFGYSIKENIAYGDNARQVPMEEIVQAAQAANIHTFIEQLPQGYDTLVGEKGAQLSGGQKQRVAIARALVRNPKLLLLDEATSALDTESEKIVQEALDRAQEGRSCLVIAHRLSTIRTADEILVFYQGKVREKGTHDVLMQQRGIYYDLVMRQMGGATAAVASE